eukprot:1144016-Pelagomonas_calceolata.AAC.5
MAGSTWGVVPKGQCKRKRLKRGVSKRLHTTQAQEAEKGRVLEIAQEWVKELASKDGMCNSVCVAPEGQCKRRRLKRGGTKSLHRSRLSAGEGWECTAHTLHPLWRAHRYAPCYNPYALSTHVPAPLVAGAGVMLV